MWVRGFLAIVGAMYAALGIWRALAPSITSRKVGFELISDSGRSEFLVVYGGLEMGLALALLLPLWRTEFAEPVLWVCVLLHGSLVLFRTASFWFYTETDPFTTRLAIGEWTIFLVGFFLVWRQMAHVTDVS